MQGYGWLHAFGEAHSLFALSFYSTLLSLSPTFASFFVRCSFILLLREAFPNKGDFLEDLKRNPETSVALKEYLDFEFKYEQYVSLEDGWVPKSRPIDVVDLLCKRKLNHEVLTLARHIFLCPPGYILFHFLISILLLLFLFLSF